jgi:hypothetical protein
MELISAYLYQTTPFDTKDISISTIDLLKKRDWYEDDRVSGKFMILNKRFHIDGIWYRVVLRFKKAEDHLQLDTPVPFMVMQSEMSQTVGTNEGITIRFKDVKAWHGREVKSTLGYFQAGVPIRLIDSVFEDLKQSLRYVGSSVFVHAFVDENGVSHVETGRLEAPNIGLGRINVDGLGDWIDNEFGRFMASLLRPNQPSNHGEE